MTWIRPDDVTVGVEPDSIDEASLSRIGISDGVILTIQHDAAVGFLHDFQELVNKQGVDVRFTTTGMGTHPHNRTVLGKLLGLCTSDAWDENCHINLKILPSVTVGGAEGNVHPIIKRLFGGVVNGIKRGVTNRKLQAGGEAESEITHGK